jgi:phage-related protein
MHAVYYRGPDGTEPVRDFLATLPAPARAAVLLQMDRLNTLSTSDPPLPFPHSSQIEGGLRELRCHYGRQLFRILYQRSDTLFVLLHAFEKTTSAVPEADQALARQRWEDYRRRMDELPRRPPRAAGHDAP